MMTEWIAFPDPRLQVAGLPWFAETTPDLHRLPPRLRPLVPEPHRHTVFAPSGARLRFASDSPSLALRLRYSPRRHLYNLSAVGALGVDLYVDGAYWGHRGPDPGRPS